MWKRVALSYWTAAVLGVILLVLHVLWLAGGGAGGEVVSGFGASLIVLGLFVAARPFIRAGVTAMARMQIPGPSFPGYFGGLEDVRQIQAEHAIRVRAVMPDVVAERIVAVLVVIIGTVLNGYSSPIARLLHLKA